MSCAAYHLNVNISHESTKIFYEKEKLKVKVKWDLERSSDTDDNSCEINF